MIIENNDIKLIFNDKEYDFEHLVFSGGEHHVRLSDVGNCVNHIELAKKYDSKVKIDFGEFWFKDIVENVEFVEV